MSDLMFAVIIVFFIMIGILMLLTYSAIDNILFRIKKMTANIYDTYDINKECSTCKHEELYNMCPGPCWGCTRRKKPKTDNWEAKDA